jgi:hypothetical protein
MAFMALLAAEVGVHPTEYRKWAKSQIGYALGDTGRSYVVGYGVNPPTQPHHRGRSAYIHVLCIKNTIKEVKQSKKNSKI